MMYVNIGGSDSTGDGSIGNPYLTIPFALSTIIDASPTKRYAIIVGSGTFASNISLKANVEVRGANPIATTISGNVDINDASWTPAGNHRSGFQDCALLGSISFDFNATSSNEGKINLYNVRIGTAPTCTSFSPINQVTFQDCLFFNGMVQNGINMSLYSCEFVNGGTYQINSVSQSLSLCTAYGGGINGPVIFTYTAGQAINAVFLGFALGSTLALSGALNILSATSDSIPIRSAVSISGGAVLSLINDAAGVAYTPATPANWSVVPNNVQNALDEVASWNSGPWTPTFTSLTAVSSPTNVAGWYSRDSNVVTASFTVTFTGSAASTGSYSFDLPVTGTEFAAGTDLIGTVNFDNNDFSNAKIKAVPASIAGQVSFYPVIAGDADFSAFFQYSLV